MKRTGVRCSKEYREASELMLSSDQGTAQPGPVPAPDQEGRSLPAMVGVRGVSKSFGSVVALDNINLMLRAGTLTSLLGPSGCGKTTLLRLIAGLETPSAGEIEINGRAVAQVPIHRRNIGLVFQNYA